jgi:hypothetical protein
MAQAELYVALDLLCQWVSYRNPLPNHISVKHKKDDKLSISYLRPISLLTVFSNKIMYKLVQYNLSKLMGMNPFSVEQ